MICSFFYLVCLYYVSIYLAIGKVQDGGLHLSAQLKDYDIKILQQNIEMEKYISEQNRQIEHQNVRFAEQDREMAELGMLIERQNTKLCELKSQITTLKAQVEILQKFKTTVKSTESPNTSSGNDTGVMFTRWGRSDCPQSISTQVYNGTTGGAHYTHKGGSVNYVCMPHDPIWNENKHYSGSSWAFLYGAEYENLPHTGLMESDVPCAVCRASPYSTTMMIPGKNKCYPDWQEAYHGELTSGYHDHPVASEYACLDEHPQQIGTQTDKNGKLFYPVRAQCGSLPCPPYEDNTLLTCVVCMK